MSNPVNTVPKPACTICTNEIRVPESIRLLPCQHLFHKTCIDPWGDANNTCPNCRAPIDPARVARSIGVNNEMIENLIQNIRELYEDRLLRIVARAINRFANRRVTRSMTRTARVDPRMRRYLRALNAPLRNGGNRQSQQLDNITLNVNLTDGTFRFENHLRRITRSQTRQQNQNNSQS